MSGGSRGGGKVPRNGTESKHGAADASFSDIAICGLLVMLWLGFVERPGVSSPPQASHTHEHEDDGDQDHNSDHVANHIAAGAFDVMVQFSTLHAAVAGAVVVGPAQVLVADGLLAVQVSMTALAAVAIVDDALLPVSEHQATSCALPLGRRSSCSIR